MIYEFSFSALGGYLIGSIPFGLVLCFLAGYGDIRKIGSGNIGATNVLRTGNKWLALLTVLLDAGKAGFAAWLAGYIVKPEPMMLFGIMTNASLVASLTAGICAILGHNFPIWLKFKGGKGVASAFGLILVISPSVALCAFLTWFAFAVAFRYSSLSAIAAAALTPVYAFFLTGELEAIFFCAIAMLVVIRHHANIARLIKGTESKITFKKKA